ncbi:asparagine--tRNA ligase-like, partial [Micropterus salmoides]|uniref:asparagine--tRNA ligase-like n=1 Tax=Micropterus salmoides TaxID=27706 RepID=UPI0018EC8DD1
LPLHGIEPKWQPHLANEEEFHTFHPGYCTSKSGPRWDDEALAQVQAKIRNGLPTPNAPPCFDFFGDASHDNLFSRIVRGEQQQWRVWEDSEHVAFLTPYPNTPGLTVVVPRKPLSSDIFKLQEADYKALILATYKVARLLEEGMRARGVALIFEGFEIDYAHAKLIPVLPSPDGTNPAELQPECFQSYPGYVSSLDGPAADPEALKKIHSKITECRPPHSWEDPQSHSTLAIKSPWYRNLFQIQNTPQHSGIISQFLPDIYLADSMQFVLEYFLRFQENLPGTYYISPSFRGEDPDTTHLNQFYHVECELLGDMDKAMSIAEGFLAHLTKFTCTCHSHAEQAGWKNGKGERVLIEKYGGAVWLTEMDHLGVPFYQAYVKGTGRVKAKAADLLLGLGETVGLGKCHSTPEMEQEALRHHVVPEQSYKWYINMRQVKPLLTSGWGMGTERYLCWLLQHDDIRDINIIPRMKGMKYMP